MGPESSSPHGHSLRAAGAADGLHDLRRQAETHILRITSTSSTLENPF